jgi:hypothetical protein
MIPYEASDGPSTSGSVHVNFLLAEAPYRPACGVSGNGESGLTFLHIRPRMPIIAVGLDDQPSRLEHKVRLEASEHRLVHFKVKTPLLEFVMQAAFDARHLGGEMLAKTELAQFLTRLRGMLAPKMRLDAEHHLASLLSLFRRKLVTSPKLAYLLPRFGGCLVAEAGLTQFLPMFRRNLLPNVSLPNLLPCLRRMSITEGVFEAKAVFVAQLHLAYLLAVSWTSPSSKRCLAHLLTGLGRQVSPKIELAQRLSRFSGKMASFLHVFNYNTKRRQVLA